MKRPTAVTVIGGIWLIIGVIVIFAMGDFIALTLIFAIQEEVWPMEDNLGFALTCAGLAAGIFVIVAGVAFLKGRWWAWISLRVLSVCGLILIFIYFLMDVRSVLQRIGGAPLYVCIQYFIAHAIHKWVMFLVFAIGFVALLRALAGQSVREAFETKWPTEEEDLSGKGGKTQQ